MTVKIPQAYLRVEVRLSLLLLAAALSAPTPALTKETERKVPMLYEPSSHAAPAGHVFGVSQVPCDTFYFGGTVWDATDGRWEAAEPSAPGWVNRKMWTWSPSGFGGTPHSGENMDGWVGVDATVDTLGVGCGDFARAEHLGDLPISITEDPCLLALPGFCEMSDSVIVFRDPGASGYPHPLCQDNFVVSPVVDLSLQPGLAGKVFKMERFGDLALNDHVFMYWQVRYCGGCDSTGWSDWLTDHYVYYTRLRPSCDAWLIDVSSYVPPSAEQVQIAMGVINLCDEDPWGLGCTYTCNASPYYDNVTFGTFGPASAPYLSMREYDYWQDQFSESGSLRPEHTADTRIAMYQSNLNPPIFGDTLVCRGGADNMEVYFVFRAAKLSPWQDTVHDFFTTWFSCVATGLWQEARMDTAEVTDSSGVSTEPVQGQWMCTFHEDDLVRLGNGLAECTEILPNNLFVPGTRIEYFLKARYVGGSDWFFLPDTSGGAKEEFEILPMMTRTSYGSAEWPCLILVDHFAQRGSGGERNSDRIVRHLNANGIACDVFNKLGPSSDLRNGIGRWSANAGQLGSPGDDKYNWGPGATLTQFQGYKWCILNAGNVYAYSIYSQDVSVLQDWLQYSSYDLPRFLWVSGDQITRELNMRAPWGTTFLNTYLCATHLVNMYSDTRGDFTYCLSMDGMAGSRITGEVPEAYVAHSNGCPRKLSVIGVSGAGGCNAAAEIEYNAGHDEAVDIGAVSRDAQLSSYLWYRTFTEAYDFCLIRSDDSQGPPDCGLDSFLTTWLDTVLTWGGYDTLFWCEWPEPECWLADPSYSTVEWRDLACNGSRVLTCPASFRPGPTDTCQTSWIYLRVMDICNRPMRFVLVEASFQSNCDLALCSSARAVTDLNGEAALYIRAGLDGTGGADCCTVTTRVSCYGMTLLEDTRPWLSPDMNADSMVSSEDNNIFTSDWLTDACRSDFNCDGIVDAFDWNIFAGHYTHACELSTTAAGDGPEAPPLRRELAQNYPNPFNPLTSIRFSVTTSGRVLLRIYDIAGRPVRTLSDGRREPGTYVELWDGKSEDGTTLPSGVYFYCLETPGHVTTKKMVLLR